jgi:predicted kinase
MLIALSGLPGTGKSTLARALAAHLRAVWLRVDSIEQGIVDADVLRDGVEGAGYQAAWRLAEDNLRLGLPVVGDCVNPWMLTRDAWRAVGLRCAVPVLEVELVCHDSAEHRARLLSRTDTPAGQPPVPWDAVVTRDYHPWTRDRLVIDTARRDLESCLADVLAAIPWRA